jgi:predicted aspartyl protease
MPVAIPFTNVDGLVLVAANVNGKSMTFIFDTGAETSLITPKALGMTAIQKYKAAKMQLAGAGGSGDQVPQANVDITFGGSRMNSIVAVAFLPKSLPPCDGLLGQDVLRQFHKITIDYKSHTLELIP